MNLNKVFILGRLTADPDLRTTPTGQPVTTLGIATNRTWTAKDGQKNDEPEFHSVVLFGKQAEVASSYLRKGSLAFFEGRLRTRTWTDKSGTQRKATEIICENMQLGPNASPKAPELPKATLPAATGPKDLAEHETLPADGDEEDTGRNMTSLFGNDEKEEIKTEDIPF